MFLLEKFGSSEYKLKTRCVHSVHPKKTIQCVSVLKRAVLPSSGFRKNPEGDIKAEFHLNVATCCNILNNARQSLEIKVKE